MQGDTKDLNPDKTNRKPIADLKMATANAGKYAQGNIGVPV